MHRLGARLRCDGSSLFAATAATDKAQPKRADERQRQKFVSFHTIIVLSFIMIVRHCEQNNLKKMRRRKKRTAVRIAEICRTSPPGMLLHDASCAHHSKVVSETCRCSDVMGDEEDAEPFRLAQLGKKMQEVHLTLTVKAAGGFIANEKSRRRSKRPCDAHAFLLSS